MKRITILFLFLSSLARGDAVWTGTAGQGVMTGSALTYGTSIVSVAFWYYPRSTNLAYQYIIDSSKALASGGATTPRFVVGLGTRSSKQVLECIGRGTSYRSQYVLAAPNVPLNQWLHVGVVCDATTAAGNFKMYLNGVAQSLTTDSLNTMNITANSSWDGQQFGIGAENTNSSPANASICEVAIWKYELPAAAFANLAAGRRPIDIGSIPYVYWPMHPAGTEAMGESIGGFALSLGTYANTNISPAIYRP